MSLLFDLGRVPVIGIVRRCPPDRVVELVGAARAAGLRVVEVTFDSQEPARQIADLRAAYPDLTVGAGTVTDLDQLEAARRVDAAFVVTPALVEEVVRSCRELGVPCVPGAASPTEIWGAHRAGASAVKVFPAAHLGGPAYLRAIRAPLGEVPLVPTGGVGPDDAADYLRAGAVALGMGSALFPREALEQGDARVVEERVGRLIEKLASEDLL